MFEVKYWMFCANIYSNFKSTFWFENMKISVFFVSENLRPSYKSDKFNVQVLLQRKSWFGMSSEWNDGHWTENTLNFEFDYSENMIFDLNEIILGMMLFYHIFL